MAWTEADAPDQTGRRVIVTGSNTGIGWENVRALAAKVAEVVMACRSVEKAEAAKARVLEVVPNGNVDVMQLDLSSLQSVADFSAAVHERWDALDILINNAGVMVPPYTKTEDGFELQIGTNHLGHFALTMQLLDLLEKAEAPRVVTVASIAHRHSNLNVDDLQWEQRDYDRMTAYGDSKIANLHFTYELARKLADAGSKVVAAAAHPGWTMTDLQRHWFLARVLNHVLAMQPPQGALPTLYAATHPDVQSGDYIGVNGFRELWGEPVKVRSSRASRDEDTSAKLWGASEQLTGQVFGT